MSEPSKGKGKKLLALVGGLGALGALGIAGGVLYGPKKAAAPPAVVTKNATPPPPVQSGENFRYAAWANAGGYEYQLDSREPWRSLTEPEGKVIEVSEGDEISFQGGDVVCALAAACTGPEGQGTLAQFSSLDPQDFPVPAAHFQALVAKIAARSFEVGRLKTYTVPAGTAKQPVQMMANIRLPELADSKYGYRIKVSIRRSGT